MASKSHEFLFKRHHRGGNSFKEKMERNRKRGKRDYRDQKEIEAEIEREMCKKIMPIKFRSKEIHMDNEID